MKIQIEIPEDAAMGRAIAGSLYITDDSKGNFRPYNRRSHGKRKKFRKLEHGSVSYNEERTTLYLSFCHEEGINEGDAVVDEAWKAKMWLEECLMHNS